MQTISASIVLYNSPIEQIQACLSSLQSDVAMRIFLVDNSEVKGRYAQFASDSVQIIDAPDNIGFGRGHNLALPHIAALQPRVHFVVNPDIVAQAGCVSALVSFILGRPDVVVAGPRIVSPEGELYHSCKLLPTPWNLFARRFAPAFMYAQGDARYELRAFSYDMVLEVSSLSGAFLAFRGETFLALRGFDPRYFMYLEDVDICRRAAKLGVLALEPRAEVIHEHGQGSYRSFRLLKEHLRSAILYFNRFGWFCDRERAALNRATLSRLTMQFLDK